MVTNEERINQLDEADKDLVQENYDGNKMSYAWSFISYATPEEFAPLLSRAKHWCYILHDRDNWTQNEIEKEIKKYGSPKHEVGTPKDVHYHILARFPTEMSLSACRKLQNGTQNLLGKMLKSIILQMKMTAYLTHDTEKARKAGKFIYAIDEVVYKPNDNYWEKQFDKEAQKEDNEATNESFVNDLLAPDLSVKEMAIKYGRDFIKNFNSYMAFRAMFIPQRQLTEAEIEKREAEADRLLNESQLELEGMYEEPTKAELYNELQNIKVEKAKKEFYYCDEV